jgi:hypothetical protein
LRIKASIANDMRKWQSHDTTWGRSPGPAQQQNNMALSVKVWKIHFLLH